MKKHKKIGFAILSLAVVFCLFMLWYQNEYSMEMVEGFKVNSPSENSKLLIATQGSEFKNTITTAIVDYYKAEPLYIEVMDISSLEHVNPDNYEALLIVHTWEMWKPPSSIQSFMDRTVKDRAKMVVLTTSGEGTYKMEGVDAFTGESKLDETPLQVGRIIKRLNPLLGLNTTP
jgi:hypothetical protein